MSFLPNFNNNNNNNNNPTLGRRQDKKQQEAAHLREEAKKNIMIQCLGQILSVIGKNITAYGQYDPQQQMSRRKKSCRNFTDKKGTADTDDKKDYFMSNKKICR